MMLSQSDVRVHLRRLLVVILRGRCSCVRGQLRTTNWMNQLEI